MESLKDEDVDILGEDVDGDGEEQSKRHCKQSDIAVCACMQHFLKNNN